MVVKQRVHDGSSDERFHGPPLHLSVQANHVLTGHAETLELLHDCSALCIVATANNVNRAHKGCAAQRRRTRAGSLLQLGSRVHSERQSNARECDYEKPIGLSRNPRSDPHGSRFYQDLRLDVATGRVVRAKVAQVANPGTAGKAFEIIGGIIGRRGEVPASPALTARFPPVLGHGANLRVG